MSPRQAREPDILPARPNTVAIVVSHRKDEAEADADADAMLKEMNFSPRGTVTFEDVDALLNLGDGKSQH